MALHYAILANGIEMLLLLASLLMLLWSTSYLLQFINLQIYTYREGHHGSPLADQCTPRLWFMNTFRSNHSAARGNGGIIPMVRRSLTRHFTSRNRK